MRDGKPVNETSVIQARSFEETKDNNVEQARERTRTHDMITVQILLKHVPFMKSKRSMLEMRHFARERRDALLIMTF